MNAALRWKLVIGCLVVAALGLPDGAAVLAHDLDGPYRVYGAAQQPAVDGRAPTWTAFDPRAADDDTTVTSVDAADEAAWDDDDSDLDPWSGARN